ncbi:MAG: tripartite tricarboxylate transporter substrate binding protein BugD [Hyphomicrobiales bacterium]|nr:tripartite tricarboxylate transporter substrate binding protein BugD [Hyphomicrobiales bacterium]
MTVSVRSIALAAAVAIANLPVGAPPARAQSWQPTRPLTMVVPFAAGGQVDVLARVLAPRLSEILGQQVVVENVGGGAGMIGSGRVARGTSDGHLFVLGSISTHALNQTLFKQPQYNVITDFTPVALIAETPLVLVTRKDLPATNLKEFTAYVKAQGDKATYGSAGVGSANHLSCILLDMALGTRTTHVPYRSGGLAMQDLVGGQIDFNCNVVSSALPQINGKLVNTIALLSRRRVGVLPNVPTAHEQGLTDFDASTWNGIFLPPRTPEPIVARLNAAILEAMAMPALQSRAEEIGASLVAPERRSATYLADFVRSEIEKWGKTIRAAGIAGSM